MKVIVAGSRSLTDPSLVYPVIEAGMASLVTADNLDGVIVVSGTARGVDRLGESWASHWGIPVLRMPADWHMYGKVAGHVRNLEMAKVADAAIVVWDGTSSGTRHMIQTMKGLGKPVFIKEIH